MQLADIRPGERNPGFDVDGLGARILHTLWFSSNLPRTALLTIRGYSFVAISRKMVPYSVCSGVFASVGVHNPAVTAWATISRVFSGCSLRHRISTAAFMHSAAELDENGKRLKQKQVQTAFADLMSVWDVMFPVERYKFIRTVIAGITVWPDKVTIEYNTRGLESVIAETEVK